MKYIKSVNEYNNSESLYSKISEDEFTNLIQTKCVSATDNVLKAIYKLFDKVELIQYINEYRIRITTLVANTPRYIVLISFN